MRFERRPRSRQRTLKRSSSGQSSGLYFCWDQAPQYVLLGRKSEPNSMAMYNGSWKANRQQQFSHPRTSAQLKTLMMRKKQQRLKLILRHPNSGSVSPHTQYGCRGVGSLVPVDELIADAVAITSDRIAFREEAKDCAESSQDSYTRPPQHSAPKPHIHARAM